MIIQVTKSMFLEAFKRQGRPDQYSHSGLCALFDYFEELEYDINEPIELDVIAICCDFSEYSLDEALVHYNCDDIDELRDEACVIEIDSNTVIIGG